MYIEALGAGFELERLSLCMELQLRCSCSTPSTPGKRDISRNGYLHNQSTGMEARQRVSRVCRPKIEQSGHNYTVYYMQI